MALEVSDFIEPTGELSSTLFPADTLTTNVAAWIADATARTDDEELQTHWVLHRAYSTVANRIHAGLSSESKGPVSAARSDAQFRYWSGKAARHLRAYRAGTPLEPVW